LSHRPRRRFGQNFLVDLAVIQQIIDCIQPKSGQRIVEIGPGKGAITRGLLHGAGELDAVELDRDLIQPLQKSCASFGELRIHNADALTFDFCSLTGDKEALRLVGNLPYNISTPILFHLLDQARCVQDMHFMLQKEVVDRMAAGPGSKTYGRLSVMLQARCGVTPLFDIAPDAFKPAPKVNSSFVCLVPFQSPRFDIEDDGMFGKVVAQAFSQRRKTLRNTLKGYLDAPGMEGIGIDPGLRAENLGVGDFVRIANLACKRGSLA